MRQRGEVVAAAVGLVAFLTTLGTAMLLRSVQESRVSHRSLVRQEAFHLAEAGIDRAALNLRTPSASDDLNSGILLTGTWTIDPPTSIGSLLYRVTAHGTSEQEQRNIEAVLQLTSQSVFQFAVFGDQTLNVSGNARTDSYDSRTGPYVEATAGAHGNVGTNATTAGGVTVGGSIFINGQVAVGPNVSDPTSVVTGYDPAFITGNPKVVSQATSFPMPSVTIPEGCQQTLPPLVGNVRTFSSSAGTYCPTGDLTVNGGEVLTADGPVKIYLSGQLDISGNATVGVATNPTAIKFLLTSTGGATVEGTITGSTLFYGALYGPNATINLSGNTEVFGSIIARTVNVSGNAELHYDEAMTTLTDISNLYQTRLLSWQELN